MTGEISRANSQESLISCESTKKQTRLHKLVKNIRNVFSKTGKLRTGLSSLRKPVITTTPTQPSQQRLSRITGLAWRRKCGFKKSALNSHPNVLVSHPAVVISHEVLIDLELHKEKQLAEKELKQMKTLTQNAETALKTIQDTLNDNREMLKEKLPSATKSKLRKSCDALEKAEMNMLIDMPQIRANERKAEDNLNKINNRIEKDKIQKQGGNSAWLSV